MDRNLKLATVVTGIASLNLGITAMFTEGIFALFGAGSGVVLTMMYLFSFLGAYQLYRVVVDVLGAGRSMA